MQSVSVQSGFLEAKSLIRLAWPVFLTQISQVSMGFVDTVMSGRVSSTDMAAVAIGSSIWFPTVLFGQGILLTLTPAVARLAGRGEHEHVRAELHQGLWLALCLSPLLMAVVAGIAAYILQAGYEPELADKTNRYLMAVMWGIPGYLLFVVLRCAMDGLSRVRQAMVVGFLALFTNIICNYVFIFGALGISARGGVGSGIATSIVCWGMPAFMLLQLRRLPDMRGWFNLARLNAPHLPSLLHYMRIGLPNALALLSEVTMFALVAILLAPLGSNMVAGHQVAISFSGLMFMAPLSLGIAITIRVGTRLGEKDPDTARRAGRAGLVLGLGIALFNALMTIAFRHQIAAVYNQDPFVQTLAASLLLFAASFQLTDSLQVITIGILRAYNDTKAIFAICFAAYWIVALPLGFVLARTSLIVPAMGPHGFWIGILVGLTLAAVLLCRRLLEIERRHRTQQNKTA